MIGRQPWETLFILREHEIRSRGKSEAEPNASNQQMWMSFLIKIREQMLWWPDFHSSPTKDVHFRLGYLNVIKTNDFCSKLWPSVLLRLVVQRVVCVMAFRASALCSRHNSIKLFLCGLSLNSLRTWTVGDGAYGTLSLDVGLAPGKMLFKLSCTRDPPNGRWNFWPSSENSAWTSGECAENWKTEANG